MLDLLIVSYWLAPTKTLYKLVRVVMCWMIDTIHYIIESQLWYYRNDVETPVLLCFTSTDGIWGLSDVPVNVWVFTLWNMKY